MQRALRAKGRPKLR